MPAMCGGTPAHALIAMHAMLDLSTRAAPNVPRPLPKPGCRLIPHALLGLLVLFQPGAFATRAYYVLAVLGMVYMNFTNAKRAAALLPGGVAALLGGAPAKPHAH